MAKFTDIAIKKLQPRETRYWVREGQGFAIRVYPATAKSPQGVKSWYYIYTFDGEKKQMRLGEGNYPEVSLADARRYFEAAKVKVKNGIDPMAEKEAQKVARLHAPTVADLVKEYIERHAKPNKKSWQEDERCLSKEVLPVWGKRKAADITKRDVVLLLQGIVDRGSPVMANNTFEKVRKMFNFAVEQDILTFTPCYGVKKPTKKEHKDRVLSDSEIVTIWQALDSAAMTDEMRRAMKLILVTAQRPGEVIGMHSSEIEGQWWTIPAERAKNGKTHRAFLTRTALDLIGEKEGYIFESPRKRKQPAGESISKHMDVNAVAYAVRRNFEEGQAGQFVEGGEGNCKILMAEAWTPHDLRRTAATKMSELGYSDEVINAVLNHVKKGVVAIYNRHKYDKEKQIALEAWERKLTSLITGQKLDNVTSLLERRA